MNATIPATVRDLVKQFAQLPGMGPKSAMRIVMHILHWKEEQTRSFGESIASLRDKIYLCERCGSLSEQKICPLCADTQRNQDILCVVPDWDSLLALDAGGFYRGQYFILGGLFIPLEKQGAENLQLNRLEERLAEGKIKELVLALGATIDAENTAGFLVQRIQKKFPLITISRLAQGIPLGGEVKHMDTETLRQSLRYRQKLAD